MRSSLDLLPSSFAAETYGWEGGLQNSFGGAEQPRMIELRVYNVGGQLVLGSDVLGGHVVLGPCSLDPRPNPRGRVWGKTLPGSVLSAGMPPSVLM